MPQGQHAPHREQPPPNAPPPPKRNYLVFSQIKGMNTKNARVGLAPDELAWLENVMPVGPNNLLGVPGNGVPVATVMGVTFNRMYDVFMRGEHYKICFASNGAGYQINAVTGSVVMFAPPGTFSAPDITIYRADRILIADPTAGYCTWDTVVFVVQGDVSPNLTLQASGSLYTSPPTFTITGGSGGGAGGTTTIRNGVVTGLQLTNAGNGGYKLGDTLTVVFAGGGGGSGAMANAFVWPFLGFTPNSVAYWQGQVWITGARFGSPISTARILAYSGTTSQDAVNPSPIAYDNFSNQGSGSNVINDADLSEGLTCVRSLNNFLYIFGNSSVKQIGSKTVSGVPLITNFTITTISSDQGTVWKDAIISFNRFVVFANTTGISAIFGATIQKISDNMDGVFSIGDFTSVIPQSAVVDLFNKHVFVLLFRINDPIQGSRNVMAALVGQSWWLLSAGNLLTICQESIGSIFELWGSYGGDVTPLFSDPTVPVAIRISTALSEDRDLMTNKRALRASISHFIGHGSPTLTWAQESENGATLATYMFGKTIQFVSIFGPINFTNNLGGVINFTAGGYLFQPLQVQATGIYLGGTLTGTVAGITVTAMGIEYQPDVPMRSGNV
jgi:hypothetical protein